MGSLLSVFDRRIYNVPVRVGNDGHDVSTRSVMTGAGAGLRDGCRRTPAA
jgi:hypothetical protein